ncbi:substrate-binding periplasmic protein [Pseudoalteromonas sp. G4]|uniref:substrate-binding periplasmic protein n=1 Tax=Pseudoalteromonas sp. G4 TaxID=2992761 RepID=UPI00406C5E62
MMRPLRKFYPPILYIIYMLTNLAVSIPSFAKSSDSNIDEVLWVTETWYNFTEKSGRGLYHEIVDAVFAHANLKVRKEYVPFKRAIHLLEKQRADFTLGVIRSENLLISDQPILSSHLSLIYNKDKITWSPGTDLKHYIGTWPKAYEKEFSIKGKRQLNGFASSNREAAIMSLLNSKADYYIDTIGMMEQTLSPLDKEKLKNYDIRAFESVLLRAAFSNSTRGRKIKAIFDKGFLSLMHSGELIKIYHKYDKDIPALQDTAL